MATATKKLSCLFSIIFLASLSVFICLNIEIVNAGNDGISQQDGIEMLHPEDRVPRSENSENVLPKTSTFDDSGSEQIKESTLGERTNVADEKNFAPTESNSSAPVDYLQLLAMYMRHEVFQRFIKGLNKTLDAHTQYAHPDFTYANTTETSGSQQRKVKYPCMQRPAGNRTALVKIVNSTELMEIVSYTYNPPNQDNTSSALGGYCAFVMFYAPWCKFSAAAAPAFNAIGRAFPDLEVLAIDAFQYNSLNTRYGIVAVPNILLFHNNKPVVRFNYTQRTFDVISDFIKNFTGLEPNSIQFSDVDSQGPLPSVVTEEPDHALWLSWLLLASVAIWFLKQRLGSAVMDRVRTFVLYARQVWRTGEFYDQVGVLVHEHHD